MDALTWLTKWLLGDPLPKWLTSPWRWFRCRVMRRHTWIDTNADGLTDTCAICDTGPFSTERPRPRSDYVIAAALGFTVLGLLAFVVIRRSQARHTSIGSTASNR